VRGRFLHCWVSALLCLWRVQGYFGKLMAVLMAQHCQAGSTFVTFVCDL
jgi:hypothetical protein